MNKKDSTPFKRDGLWNGYSHGWITIEVVEPESVRKEMRNFAKNLLSYYKEKQDE